jgi:cytochrome c peroxidase
MSARALAFALLAIAAAPLSAQQGASQPTSQAASPAANTLDERTRTLAARLLRDAEPPADPTNRFATDPRAAALGQFLFFDKRLSPDGKFACATCHDPARAFTDGEPLARGRVPLARNTPTLLDAARTRWLFWDGRADSLWSQALVPLEAADEMGTSRCRVAHHVASDPELKRAYESLFGALPELTRVPLDAGPLGGADDPRRRAWLALAEADRTAVERVFANVGKALAAYERKLVSQGSAFDLFVSALRAGDPRATATYPEAAQRGLALFLGRANCRSCHVGPTFSDQEFHNIGVPARDGLVAPDPARHAGIEQLLRTPFNSRGLFSDERDGERASELGQLAATPEVWAAWRTPSLRNVARTAPYMHQGQFATLRDVLEYYSTLKDSVPVGHHGEKVLAPLHLSASEVDELVAFLETLSDPPLPGELLRAPASPFATADAPAR